MADFQFHSADCPVWHPEKFLEAGGIASKCWCQRWSNLVDWNTSDVVSNDAMLLNVKKDVLLNGDAPKQTDNVQPVLQTDAILGSNLWGDDALKLEGDLSVDLDILWKKLDEPNGNCETLAFEPSKDALKPLSVDTSTPGPSTMFLSPMDALPNGPEALGIHFVASMQQAGISPQGLSLVMPSEALELDDLTKGTLDLDPVALFEESFMPDQTGSPSPSLADPLTPAPSVVVETDRKATPKRRGRPPGKANKRKLAEAAEGEEEPKRSRKRSLSIAESLSDDLLDPTSFVISPDDLKPTPIIRKSKKKLTPEEQKDERYWARREKNNVAAKRSRDIRRLKENQIAVRAAFLESEIKRMETELDHERAENEALRKRLEAFEGRKR